MISETISVDRALSANDSPCEVMPSWERRDELGIWTAGWRSVWELLFHRQRTFSALPLEGVLYGPLLYGVAVGCVGVWFCLAGLFLFCNPQFFLFSIEQSQTAVQHLSYIAIAAVASPVVLCVWMTVVSYLCHSVLKQGNPSVESFAATSRVVSYGMGTSCLFIGIPLFFWMVGVLILNLMDSRISTLAAADANANQIVNQILNIQWAITLTRKIYLFIHCMCVIFGVFWLTAAVKTGLRRVHSLSQGITALALLPLWLCAVFLWIVVFIYALVKCT